MPTPDSWLAVIQALALAFAGSLMPAFLFHFDGRNWFFVGLSGALGWGVFLITTSLGAPAFTGLYLAACCVALYGEAVNALLKSDSPAFTVGGIFPLVPGLSAFQTLEFVLKHQNTLAFDKGIETLSLALAVALGILSISGLFAFRRKIRHS